VSSGAVDAISFLALGKVFTAFMTGNLAFLGMGIAGSAGAPGSLATLASMAGFAGGIYVGTIIVTPSRQPTTQQGEPVIRLVWPQRITYALAISLLPHLAFVAIWLAAAGKEPITMKIDHVSDEEFAKRSAPGGRLPMTKGARSDPAGGKATVITDGSPAAVAAKAERHDVRAKPALAAKRGMLSFK
jgi:hypothetical protein